MNHPDERLRDQLESEALYDILEYEIAPMFYDRDEQGIPYQWVDRVRRSMSIIGPRVSAERMVRDYCTELYIPAGRSARAVADIAAPREFAGWQGRIRRAWPEVRIHDVACETPEPTAGSSMRLTANVALGELTEADVRVEAILGRKTTTGELIAPTAYPMTLGGEYGEGRWGVDIELDDPGAFGYTVRVVPNHALLRSPAELGLVQFPRP